MDVKELEAKFKQIDQRAEHDEIEVNVEDGQESSASLNITVTVAKSPGAKPESPLESTQETETLLNIDLADVDIPDSYIDEMIDAAFLNEAVGQLPGVKVSQRDATAEWEVVEDYTYQSNEQKFSITALKGFVFDRASIPRPFWVIISKDDLSNVPPLFHDLLYRNVGILPTNQVTPFRTFQRKDADDLFLELMKKTGVKSWRARLAYHAVRRFAAFAWKAK